ncbi:hypothetical protein E2C01_090788 [Portunus trituberculatus]|uniref:Uncharacterized protein n=1 Tax=Portunus trituberculatus TaxID=210409 RepID=A0A5B7JFP2_PORTR|nr:hypothetical protein [Portunus trituberculatus]
MWEALLSFRPLVAQGPYHHLEPGYHGDMEVTLNHSTNGIASKWYVVGFKPTCGCLPDPMLTILSTTPLPPDSYAPLLLHRPAVNTPECMHDPTLLAFSCCSHDLYCIYMVAELDQIAEACRSKLRTTVPNHPAIASPLVPSSEILPESKWDQERCNQLMKCINDVLFNQTTLRPVQMSGHDQQACRSTGIVDRQIIKLLEYPLSKITSQCSMARVLTT